MTSSSIRLAGSALALSLGLALSACGGIATNRSLDSLAQPVVQRSSYTIDLATLPEGGITGGEAHRLADWFAAMNLRYGDHIAVDDATASPVTRAQVGAVASRFGLLLDEVAPVTAGTLAPGMARVVVSRTVATVPNCPNWGSNSDFNPNNATAKGFGCSVNSNLAAMVADKEQLIHGATSTGETAIMRSNRAIEGYQTTDGTGKGGAIKQQSAGGN